MSDKQPTREEVAERHRATAAGFTDKVDRVTDWDAPTPVDGWVARDVVRHLVDWSRGLFGSAEGVTFGTVPDVDVDPAACWHRHTEQMQMLLDHPAIEKVQLDNEHFGRQPLLSAIDRFYVHDVFMHTWDLARAIGVEPGLDQARCHAMLEAMEADEAGLRASGQFGTRQAVADDAASDEKLMAFIGRDPYWTPAPLAD